MNSAVNHDQTPQWWEWKIECSHDTHADRVDAFTDALLDAGALSVQLEDADVGSPDEQAIYGEPGMLPNTHWRRNIITVLLSATDFDARRGAILIRDTAQAQNIHLPEFLPPMPIAAQNWVHQTQAQFPPIDINHQVRIIPSWHQTAGLINANTLPNQINLILDPGLAFGTGSHPTTFLCLNFLDAHLKKGDSVLDYGCGSGILALLAFKRGATPVFATDIDPQALRTAQENALANQCEITISAPDHVDQALAQKGMKQCAWVVANILTNPLIALAPVLARYRAVNGRLLLSGILDSQVEQVIAAYAPYVSLRIANMKEGWVALVND